MAKYEGKDHYLDPETGVLKNKLGIVDEDELKKAEASLVAWRSFQLAEKPIQGRFDLEHLKAIHKHNYPYSGNHPLMLALVCALPESPKTGQKDKRPRTSKDSLVKCKITLYNTDDDKQLST